MSQRSIEVKVGILILVALGLLGAFVVVMGGLSLQPTYTVYVDFDNPGALKPGAPVRISSVKVGRVASMEFRGDVIDTAGRREPLIRVVASLESSYRNAIFEDSRWFITTQGVLGEQYLAVDPGTPSAQPLKDGAVVQGISPPRLDLLLSEAYELLHYTYVAVTQNEKQIAETFDGLHRTLKGTGDLFEKHGDRIDRIFENVETLTVQANETLLAVRHKYVENPQIDRILRDAEGVSSAMNRDLGPLVKDGRELTQDLSRLTDALASEEQLERYRQITRDMGHAAGRARRTADEAQRLIEHIKAGKGTVGAIVMDEAVYDDLHEMLRDLKHNPWKLFWKE
jgi:phospholipid/cholesterol/gamma-HCH transport system substrate-binding protein